MMQKKNPEKNPPLMDMQNLMGEGLKNSGENASFPDFTTLSEEAL